jgi:hypothetical protein
MKFVTFIEPRQTTNIEIDPDTNEVFVTSDNTRRPIAVAGPEVSATISIITLRYLTKLPPHWTEATVVRKTTPLGISVVMVFKTSTDSVYIFPMGGSLPIPVKSTYEQTIDMIQ